MMRDIEAHPEEYVPEHLEKLRTFSEYSAKDLEEFLIHSDLMTKNCKRIYGLMKWTLRWLIAHIEEKFPDEIWIPYGDDPEN